MSAETLGQAALRDLILKRWNEILTTPDDPEVDYAQASLAAETALAAFAAQEPEPAPGGQWTVAEFAAALDSFYAWFTVAGGGARVQGQLLGADADEFARALHAGLESARARRAGDG